MALPDGGWGVPDGPDRYPSAGQGFLLRNLT
jgi:hypothetical protein